jgi:RsiW-degrading membrane proteinase PrsW (M82 family)
MADIGGNGIIYAIIGGGLPTLLWLLYWVRATSQDGSREPFVLLIITYIAGGLGVFLLLPLKGVVEGFNLSPDQTIVVAAALEEIVKFAMVAIVAFRSFSINEPNDYALYLLTGALGFSAVENTLYLLNPIVTGVPIGTLAWTATIRFIGATTLHVTTVSLVGVMMGYTFFDGFMSKMFTILVGIGLGVGLHSLFNYFILPGTTDGTVTACAGLWFVAVIVFTVFKRLSFVRESAPPVTPSV